jgi:thiamine-monophosphate kinase
MGATPRLALLSIALPQSLTLDDFDCLVSGFASLASRYRLHLAGGNLTRSPGPLMLDVTAIGTVKRRQALTRAGARPGDELYVSGTIGAAAAGLQMLKARAARATTEDMEESCIERYLRPDPRVRLGTLVSRNRAAAAALDLSDGLADGVQQLARASGVGAIVDVDALPIVPAIRRWFESRGLDAAHEAMTAGDDYELLVAVRPRAVRRFSAAIGGGAVSFTRVGVCTEELQVVMRRQHDGQFSESPLPHAAYKHFR